MIDGGIPVAAGAHLDLDSDRGVGRLHGRSADHAQGRGPPEQSPEVHRLAEVGDAGFVDGLAGHALGEELELGNGAGWGVPVLAADEGGEKILVEDRDLPPIAHEAHVAAGEGDRDARFEILIDIGDDM